jgi:phage terminase Nu1 subunit (DNA packaging protein)
MDDNTTDVEKKRKAIIKGLKRQQAELAKLKKDYQEMKENDPEFQIEEFEWFFSQKDKTK